MRITYPLISLFATPTEAFLSRNSLQQFFSFLFLNHLCYNILSIRSTRKGRQPSAESYGALDGDEPSDARERIPKARLRPCAEADRPLMRGDFFCS